MKIHATMMLQRAFHLSLLLATAASERQIIGNASVGNYIHAEAEVDLSSAAYRSKIDITSDVPVTVQRYSDGGSFFMGQQPVPENMAKVLVTSDCDTSSTQLVPKIEFSSEGSITVTLGVTEEEANAMPFLEPSSYSAIWTWVSDLCGFNPAQSTISPIDDLAVATTDACPQGQCLDPDGDCGREWSCDPDPCSTTTCGEDEVCVTNYCGGCLASCTPAAPILIAEPITVTQQSCDSGGTCNEEGTTCARGTETCCGVTHDSFMCECADNGNGRLEYSFCLYADACMMPSCCGSGSPADMPPAAPGTCNPGSLCDTGIEDDYCCTDMQGAGTYCSKSGGSTTVPPVMIEDPADTTTPSCPESLDGIARPDASTVLYYALVPSNPPGANNGLLCARLEAKGEGWVSFGVSVEGEMIGSDAIIGMPDDNTVLKYDLAGKSSSEVVAMDDYKQTLMDTSISQDGGITIMKFTKMLVEDLEITILEEGVNNFIFAKGSSNVFGYHSTRSAFTKDFSEDVVPPSTTSTTTTPSDTTTTITTTEPLCDSGGTCNEEGSTCTEGTETCCGETYDSFMCTCGDNGNGSLEYSCFFTDACMVPPCCIPGPPTGMPPPADGTCVIGELCETSIDDDYCCYDVQGGTGTYCSKSGGSTAKIVCEVSPDTDTCGTGEFCQLDTGACNEPSDVHGGICAEIPEVCTEEWDPVCGCDGRTYSNVCNAHSAGISVSSLLGECGPTPTTPTGPVMIEDQADTTTPSTTTITTTEPLCDSLVKCYEEGSTCTEGTETCCGETYDSFMCTCEDNGNGSLEYSCFFTDACLVPPCCIPGPPAGMPPPADGTCVIGELCKTSIDDDYCCYDEQGGTGTYCSKSGGKISETEATTPATPESIPPSTMSSATELPDSTTVPPIAIIPGDCEVGPDTDTCGTGEFCQLDTGACNGPSDVHSGQCAEIPEVCTEEWDPVCGCDDRTYSSVCKAHSAGSSVSVMGACSSTTLATAESVMVEATTSPISSTLPATSPLPDGKTKYPTYVPTQPPTQTPTPEEMLPTYAPTPSGDGTLAPTKSQAPSVNAGSPSKEATTSVATTVTSTTATTSASTTDASTTGTTTVSSLAIDGDFPTEAPSTKPSTNDWWEEQEDPDRATSPNSAFNHSRSFLFCVATTFMALAILPGSGGNNNLWGFGKFAVAAMAVSSLYSKTSPASNSGSIRKSNNKVPKSFPAQNERALQTCTYNVEILIDGCTHPLEISAPSGRVVDVVIEDLDSQQSQDDSCVTDNVATLKFPVTDETIVLNLEVNGTVDTFPEYGFQCQRVVIGRPFVDATGGSLHAMPWFSDGEAESAVSALSWTGEALIETQASPFRNATSHGRFLLGEDWIQRALGEHASIASFSAFSIALMSNSAPAGLVEDALKAGLDEVRHSRTSFDIASKLTGKEVGPGPLPESKFEFGQDLKALALAVAREGCVDETLSAFAAAVEVEHITDVLDDEGVQDTLYSNIDRDLLAFIRNELVTIAMDESNHSALAWRTLNWVCSVDRSVCDAVYMDVFEESNLEMRFKQRADRMKGEWKKIFNAHQLARSGSKGELASVCIEADMVEDEEDKQGKGKTWDFQRCPPSSSSLLTSLTENIIRQVSCS